MKITVCVRACMCVRERVCVHNSENLNENPTSVIIIVESKVFSTQRHAIIITITIILYYTPGKSQYQASTQTHNAK